MLKPGTRSAKCLKHEEAKAEIERLMTGIPGFEDCTVFKVVRIGSGWMAYIDDPANEFEYETFCIDDDGGIDWS